MNTRTTATQTRQAARPRSAAPPAPEAWIAIASVTLLYAGHVLFAAYKADTTLLMDMAASLLLTGCLLRPDLRADLLRLRGLALPGALYAFTIAVALWTLTPHTPGGPHPIWDYLGLAPASTIDRSGTTLEIIKLLGLGCFFLIGAAVGGSDERAQLAVRLVVWAGVALGLWAILGAASGSILQSQVGRLEAHFLNPNTAGNVFAALLILAINECQRAWRRTSGREVSLQLIFAAAAATILLVCMVGTASRGAALALLGGLLAVLALQILSGKLRPTRATLGVLAGAAVALLAVGVSGEFLTARFFNAYESAGMRNAIYAIHWRAFLNSPLFGYGLGTFDTVNKTLLTHANFQLLWDVGAALNLYLQWLEEAGLVGALPMFACVALLLLAGVRGAARRTRMVTTLAAVIGALVVFLLHGVTDSALQAPSVAALFSWLLGLQFGLAQGGSRR